MKIFIVFFLFILLLVSCTTVKEYQKMYLNDYYMKLDLSQDEYFETTFQTNREGAAGANGGKTGGGCGCN